ncbi:nuclease-related domain-containing protein [Lederbergia citrea]|uniref:nuclease-related domain-containing protein n=1 Tax=Lederbergia citrea TaxID=2833581 RepID=UPI001BC8E8E7|nr:nuclease-related domain-containing protein [Lederbergia citrea]MBS4205502.1 NERD domain-containing protein [Lederbergia citrea]
MFIKPRYESTELQLLRYLSKRMNLTDKEKQYYVNLKKGYEGELSFDMLLENLSDEWLILSDLLLEVNNTMFQIDSLLVSRHSIFLFEVKNYEGDYYIDADKWYSVASGNEIKDPLLQLKRSEFLLRRLLQDLNFNFSIEAYLIFISPKFTLYQAPRNLPIIFPTQLHYFMKNLNKKSSKLNEKHSGFAELLVNKHLNDSSFTQVPNYDYEQLRKGVICKCCYSFLISREENKLVCAKCLCKEDIESAILRNVEQLTLLFPDKKVTTNLVHEWCEAIVSKKRVWRILTKNFRKVGQGKFSYYVHLPKS